MQDRIQKILKEEGMTAARFADEIGIQASSVSHFLSGRNKPSTDILARILDRFRGLNAEWLVTGRGNMYKDQDKNERISLETPNFSDKTSSVADLFSANSTETEIDEDLQANETTENTAESLKSPDSNASPVTTKPPLSENKREKQISHIVIFFTDNSFEYYNPRK